MYDHGLAGQRVSPSRLVQLQGPSFKLDGIGFVYGGLMLRAEDPVQIFASKFYERAAFL